ncbi:molybdate ABC transporter substrate-binding protein [Aquibacillus rhizosphaerae]|uniref:Molybdate ABC transporter substrate-binding protein n=1 Tax=Aquibacillus rhizosphaerae TaxID=3051431 RepID=A0ABT7LBU0_9BACI|nr:molybdate ABC transporter substrate-binding protein [Aquibacillus sp. LR5S19]MDL4842031.1 molybdate ABC transporter substrate-binding protein [Aquibacillus sp. LR5S19]
MHRRMYLYLSIIIMLIFITGCSSGTDENDEKTELTISVAASMVDAMEQVSASFEQEHKEIDILINAGSSGALQQQIIKGAPVDLFLSASATKFDLLLEKQLINETYYTNVLENELVLIKPTGAEIDLNSIEELLDEQVEKVAIGTTETVPAGEYAKQSLENMSLYEKIEGKLIPAKDVRQVLNYVETNNVQAGIVYKTDAAISESVEIVTTFSNDTHTSIIYPLGILKSTKQVEEAMLFYEFINSDTALQIFEEYGFKPIGE